MIGLMVEGVHVIAANCIVSSEQKRYGKNNQPEYATLCTNEHSACSL